jgi:integrase
MRYPSPWIATGHGSYRQLAADTFEITWRDAGHHFRRRVNWPRQEVLEFLLNAAVNRQRTAAGAAPRLSWRNARDAYLQAQAVKENTATYRAQVRRLIEALAAAARCELHALAPVHLELWRQTRASALQRAGRRGWARTVNKESVMLSAFLEYSRRVLRALPTNPAEALTPYAHQPKPKRNLTPAEYARVWRLCEPSLQDLLAFLLCTGCRFGEAQRMKRADVAGAVWIMADRKAGNTLRQPLSPALLEIVARQPLLPDGLVWHRWVSPGVKGHGHVPEKALGNRWLYDCLAARCRRADVPRFGPHDLRHAAATWLRTAGTPLDQIQQLLGHSTVTTTELYAHLLGGGVAKVLQERLAELARNAAQDLQA